MSDPGAYHAPTIVVGVVGRSISAIASNRGPRGHPEAFVRLACRVLSGVVPAG